MTQKNLTYFIETYGCQMNAHESEKIAGVLENIGYTYTDGKNKADLIIFNTCCVREHAEARLYGNVGALREHKKNVAGAVIAVCGCMMQQQDAAKKLAVRFPFVDIVFGTNHIQQLEGMLSDVLLGGGRRVLRIDEDETVIEGLPALRNSLSSAYVNIIYGCNNFCTYCVVPFVRGRERSRRSADILSEINALCDQGITEVTLLGQNVNSYGKGTDIFFPELLNRIDEETGVKRLRFMTSHPKDLTDELIGCYGRIGCLCEHIHLPVQSGSDRILERMNRRYTKAHYLSLVERLRDRVPDIAVTTDIIVGFPGESDADFADTIDLVNSVKFDAAYTFAYSKRALTKAAGMPGQIDKQTKKERLKKLNSLVGACMLDNNKAYIGKEVEVLVENSSKRNENEISGRTRTAKTVNFEGSAHEIGWYVSVKIDKVKAHTLHGVRAGEE
ncbi:MAG: tRNA (N6-isopentenyl adenosine(37)-C2)-methylthiotransferase MiaB [Eubacteriales bacterium]|nr:tRNA (N6-isopentenyl adenosine(37)-C2)-methylthiotransferase MiaB [Eubacteriales bacterium]